MKNCEHKAPLGRTISYNTVVEYPPRPPYPPPYPPPCPPPYPPPCPPYPPPPPPPIDDHNKISHLPEIQHIDDNDLFLVSDFENGRFWSKKLSVGHMMDYIADTLESSMISDIVPSVISSQEMSAQISTQVESTLSSSPALSGAISSVVREELDQLITVIDGGSPLDP